MFPKEIDGQGKFLFAPQSEPVPEQRYSLKIVPIIECAPIGENAVVILNQEGKLITTYGKARQLIKSELL